MLQSSKLQNIQIILVIASIIGVAGLIVFLFNFYFFIVSIILMITADFTILKNKEFAGEPRLKYLRATWTYGFINGLIILLTLLSYWLHSLPQEWIIFISLLQYVFVVVTVIASVIKWRLLSKQMIFLSETTNPEKSQEWDSHKKSISQRLFHILITCSILSLLIMIFGMYVLMSLEVAGQGNEEGGLGAAVIAIIGGFFEFIIVIAAIVLFVIMIRAKQKNRKRTMIIMAVLLIAPSLIFSPIIIANLPRFFQQTKEAQVQNKRSNECYQRWTATAPTSERRAELIDPLGFRITHAVSWRELGSSEYNDGTSYYLEHDPLLIKSIGFKNPATCSPIPANLKRDFSILVLNSNLDHYWQQYAKAHNYVNDHTKKSTLNLNGIQAQVWDYFYERTVVLEKNGKTYVLVFSSNQKEHQIIFKSFRLTQ